MGLKSSVGGGEIVQVEGGHIIRATGRKDRHSKVFTAKGPRDRRVRLSAHTAIQFYDVQDRLGYDRPSKAVDWLMKKAKSSINKLAELPPWDPIGSGSSNAVDFNGGCSEFNVGDYSGSSSFYVPQQPQCMNSQSLVGGGGGDSMKSFFPMNGGNNNGAGEHSISFQNYTHDLVSRGGSQNQDLCLSLHTLQDPSGGASGGHPQRNSSHDSGPFRGSGSSLGLNGGNVGWGETHNPHDLAQFTKMIVWPAGVGGATRNGGDNGGDTRRENIFNAPPSFSPQGSLLGQTSTAYSQRGTLQSNFAPLVRVLDDHQHEHHNHNHHHEFSNIGHGSDQFMGFYIPPPLHGHQLHGGSNSMSNNRASSSSLSPDSSQH